MTQFIIRIHKVLLLIFLQSISAICFAQIGEPVDSVEDQKNYNIVFLLPFHSQKVFINDLSTSDFSLPGETQVSVELYQGALLALDSLIKLGFNATINSFEISSDSASMQSILKKKELKDADLIIGPLNGYSLKQAASFATREHIPLISPLSATVPSSEPNQFLILANATIRTHCEFIYDYLVQHELVHRMILMYRKNTPDLELANFIKDYRNKMVEQGTPRINFVEITDSNVWKLKDSLFFTDKNIVVIASSDEKYVRNITAKLSDLQKEYSVELVGMPTWNSFTQIPFAKFDSLKLKITSSFYLDTATIQAKTFKAMYYSKFGFNPSVTAVKGYNIMLYFGNQLLKADNKIMGFFPSATSIGCNFKIVPVMKSPDIMYRENKSVFMLEHSWGKWKLAQ